ncbi:MAG: tetratricopeptide repeat protein [Candidatus Thorarchaeota archaeon]|nr:tetratricopeptide repeat protein [Candidatus Thorarchaeota archaeon]
MNSESTSDFSRDSLYHDALQLYADGQLEEANAILLNIITLDSEDLEAWLQLGLVLEDLNDFRGAIEAYSQILERDENQSSVWLNLGYIYFKMGAHKKAEGLLKTAMEVAIENGQPRADIWNNYGALCAETNRYEEAQKMFEIVVKLDPSNKKAGKNLFEVKRLSREAFLESLDGRKLAVQAIERADDPTWWYEFGTAHRLEGDRQQAIMYLSKAIEMDPTLEWAHYELAYTYYREKQFRKAQKHLFEAIKLDKRNALFLGTMGTICSLLGDKKTAERAHRCAVKLDEWDGRLWSQLGTFLHKEGRYGEAKEVADKAVEVSPNLDMAWNLRGVVLLGQHKYKESIDAFEKVLQINPGFSDAWNNIALAKQATDRLEDAINACKKGIETGPHRREAWIDLIKFLYQAERDEEAKQIIKEARESGIEISIQEELGLTIFSRAMKTSGPEEIEEMRQMWLSRYENESEHPTISLKNYEKAKQRILKDIDDETAWYDITLFHIQSEKYEEAVPGFLNLIRLRPKIAQFRADFGYMLHLMGRNIEAEEHLTEAVRMRPDDELTLRRLIRLLDSQKRYADAKPYRVQHSKFKDADRHSMYG